MQSPRATDGGDGHHAPAPRSGQDPKAPSPITVLGRGENIACLALVQGHYALFLWKVRRLSIASLDLVLDASLGHDVVNADSVVSMGSSLPAQTPRDPAERGLKHVRLSGSKWLVWREIADRAWCWQDGCLVSAEGIRESGRY